MANNNISVYDNRQSDYLSFTNSLYDNCNIKKKEQESTGPYNWITDKVNESQNPCFVGQSPFMHNQFQSIPTNLVDAESDLRNQTRLLSRCPEARFDPTKLDNCQQCEKCNQGLPCGCAHCKDTRYNQKLTDCTTDFLVPSYTRVKKPCNIFSGITINRFNPLCDDLQDTNKIQSNSYIGANTRLQIRDAFRNEPLQNLKLQKTSGVFDVQGTTLTSFSALTPYRL